MELYKCPHCGKEIKDILSELSCPGCGLPILMSKETVDLIPIMSYEPIYYTFIPAPSEIETKILEWERITNVTSNHAKHRP